MNIGSREIFEQSSNAIPYVQVEWIEPATANSVIDTQVKCSSKIEFEIVADKVFKSGTSSNQYMIGYDSYFAGDQTRKNCLFFGNGTSSYEARFFEYGGDNFWNSTLKYPSSKATYAFKNLTYSENGVVKKTFSAKSFSTNANLYLLGCNSVSDTNTPHGNVGCKMYSCKIWEDKVLARDFIPVKHNGVGYMYDLCSKQLFGSISGSFILGPQL